MSCRCRNLLSRFDVNSFLDYAEFRTMCIELCGADEIKENEQKTRELFELFDMDADGVLKEQELRRCYEWIRAIVNPVNVLLIVDMQNDFIDGAMALRSFGFGHDAAEVVEPINRLLKDGCWDKVIYSQDWHPEDHISFFENLMKHELHPESKVTKEKAQLFDTVTFLQPHITQTLWPKHCVMNTWGAELHKDLLVQPSAERIYKGQKWDKEIYSAFGNIDTNCEDDSTKLKIILLAIHATHLYVCGVAYDVCVKMTCLDGLQLGYTVILIDDCSRGTKPENVENTNALISENGGLVMHSDRVLSLVNESKQSLLMAYNTAKRMIRKELVS